MGVKPKHKKIIKAWWTKNSSKCKELHKLLNNEYYTIESIDNGILYNTYTFKTYRNIRSTQKFRFFKLFKLFKKKNIIVKERNKEIYNILNNE